MAVKRNYTLPHSREVIGITVISKDGKETESANIIASREFYRWMAMVERLVGTSGPLFFVENNVTDQASEIAEVANAINTTNSTLTQTNADVQSLSGLVSTLATQLSTLTSNFNDHIALESAHGANGDIVGASDAADFNQPGLVAKGTDPLDSVAATVPEMVVDHNKLLTELRAAGIL